MTTTLPCTGNIDQRLPEDTPDQEILRLQGQEKHLQIVWRIVNRQHVVHLYNVEAGGYVYGDYCGGDTVLATGAVAAKMRTWGSK